MTNVCYFFLIHVYSIFTDRIAMRSGGGNVLHLSVILSSGGDLPLELGGSIFEGDVPLESSWRGLQ